MVAIFGWLFLTHEPWNDWHIRAAANTITSYDIPNRDMYSMLPLDNLNTYLRPDVDSPRPIYSSNSLSFATDLCTDLLIQ